MFNLYTYDFSHMAKNLFSSIQTSKITENMRFLVTFCHIQVNIFKTRCPNLMKFGTDILDSFLLQMQLI